MKRGGLLATTVQTCQTSKFRAKRENCILRGDMTIGPPLNAVQDKCIILLLSLRVAISYEQIAKIAAWTNAPFAICVERTNRVFLQ